jgi:subtilisin-like proprotein convertase family protein
LLLSSLYRKSLWFSLLFFVCCLSETSAQCSYNEVSAIVDDGTTSLQLEISGAANDDLASLAQCVASVSVDFEHQFVGDINIELISPAGQSVRLVGMAVASSPSTALINWSVDFLPCNEPVSPDAGFPDAWDNLAGWASFTNYTGSYYPNAGCLESYNTGSVNGIWTLVVSDISQFGEGEIRSFSIEFCDDTDIVCGACTVVTPSINTTPATICVDDVGPVPNADLVFPAGYIPTPDYVYEYALFDDVGLVGYRDEVLLESLSVGTYELCPVGYRQDLASLLPSPSSVANPSLWAVALNNLNICATASADCYPVTIAAVPDTVTLAIETCLGDTLTYSGVDYTMPTTVYESAVGPACDTVRAVSIGFIDAVPGFSPGAPVLNCQRQELWLGVDTEEVITASWSTTGGNIITQSADSILINAAGTYIVTATDRGCIDSSLVVVVDDSDRPSITVEIDTLDCVTDTVTLRVDSNEALTLQWRRPGGILNVADSLITTEPGTYAVTATAANGCFTVESFDIVVDTALRVPDLQIFAISCLVPLRRARVTAADSSYSYRWTGPSGYTDNILAADSISEAGIYTVVFTAPNGCQGDTSFVVQDARRQPDLNLDLPVINCSAGPFVAQVRADRQLSNVSWLDVDQGVVYGGDSVVIDDGGIYELSYATADGCLYDTTLVIDYDTIRPFLSVGGGLLDCVTDSIQLSVIGDTTGVSFLWTGPNDFENRDAMPFVNADGTYTLRYFTSNGCIAIAEAIVDQTLDKPDVSFGIEYISCLRDSAFVSVSDPSYDYSWSDNLLGSSADSLIWDQPGTIGVTITDPASGCQTRRSLSLIDFRQGARVDIESEEFGCGTDSIQLEVTVEDSIVDFTWTGISGFYQDSLQPFVFDATQVILTTEDPEGCISRDTFVPAGSTAGPAIIIRDTIITCDRPRVTLLPESDIPLDSTIWRGPSLFSPAFSVTVGSPGLYRLEAYTADGCVVNIQQNVVDDTADPTILIDMPDTLECLDMMVDLNANSLRGIAYTWRDSLGTVLSNVSDAVATYEGIFSVEVQDDNGCTGVADVIVSSNIEFPTIAFEIDRIDCDSDTTTISATSSDIGNSYNWLSPGRLLTDSVLVGDVVGNYIVEVTNALGCIDTFTAESLIDTTPPLTQLVFEDTLSCNSPQVFLTGVDVSSTYLWLDVRGDNITGDTLVVADSRTYQAQITGANGCVDTGSVFLPIDTSLLTLSFITDTLSCFEGKVGLEVVGSRAIAVADWSGPLSYTNSGDSVVVFTPGIYNVEVVGANGCATMDSVEVLIDESVINGTVDEAFLPCDSSGTILSVTSLDSVYQLRWTGPAGFFSEVLEPQVFDAGTYVVSVAGESGCFTQDTFNLDFDQDLPVFDVQLDSFTCVDQQVVLRALDTQDDLSVAFYRGNTLLVNGPVLTTADTGVYQMIVIGQNRCRDTIDVRPFDDRITPQVSLNQIDTLVCDQDQTQLLASVSDSIGEASFVVSWRDPAGGEISNGRSANVSTASNYTFEAVNQRNGCSTIDTLDVLAVAEPDLDYSLLLEEATCEGFNDGMIIVDSVIGGFAPYEYSLDGENFRELNVFEFLDGGDFTVYTRDRYGCRDSVNVSMQPGANPTIELPADTLLRLGDSLEVNTAIVTGNTPIYTLSWDASGASIFCDTCEQQSLLPFENTWVSVVLIDELGCQTSDEMLIRVNRLDDVVMPNVFRPTGDPTNQIFFFPDVTGVAEVVTFRIYDRSGSLVHERSNFEPGDQTMGWDGRLHGDFALSAVYAFYIKVIYVDGSEELFVGDVTLLR